MRKTAGSKLTIEDVARAAGVSRSTVSRVMNGVPGATESVRRHVKEIIAELGYVPDQTARALASRQQPAVDVVVASPVSAVSWISSHIDAMFVACDLTAAGAVQAITATGRRVPQDVSVVGFDDSIAAVCANPPLSTMRMPVEDMASAATRLLLDGPVPAGYRQRFPVELIVRESTAPCRWP